MSNDGATGTVCQLWPWFCVTARRPCTWPLLIAVEELFTEGVTAPDTQQYEAVAHDTPMTSGRGSPPAATVIQVIPPSVVASWMFGDDALVLVAVTRQSEGSPHDTEPSLPMPVGIVAATQVEPPSRL